MTTTSDGPPDDDEEEGNVGKLWAHAAIFFLTKLNALIEMRAYGVCVPSLVL
jgi:hypothetical protein